MRIKYLDNISALMVLYMVFYHAAYWFGFADSTEYLVLYSIFFFFMPWFFFKAGMFAKEEKILETVIKGCKGLLIPYLIWGFFSWLVLSFPYYTSHSIWNTLERICYMLFTRGIISGDNSPLWFLLTLFFVRIIFCMFRKWPNVLMLISVICAYLCSIYCNAKNFPLLVANTFSGLFFYSLGYVLRNYKPDRKTMLLLLVFFVTCAIYEPSHVDMYINQLQSGSYILWIITSVAGIICVNAFFRRFLNKEIWCLSFIGRYSMVLYVTHWPLYYIFVDYNILKFDVGWIGCMEFLSLLIVLEIPLMILLKTKVGKVLIGK